MSDYSLHPDVLARMVEYIGTCVYLSRIDLPQYDRLEVRPPWQVSWFLRRGLDLGRSLWDRRYLLAHLDIEYLNLDSAAEPYLDPGRVFELQEPVIGAALRILREYGIRPLHLLTGRGHHLVWQVPQKSAVFERIHRLGRVPPSLRRYDEMSHPPYHSIVPQPLSAGHAGVALLMEFWAQRIKREAGPLCRLPVELSDIAVQRSERGRELVLLDLSEYHDPLHTRTVRVPFTIYRKPWAKGVADDPAVAGRLQTVVVIPRLALELPELLELRADLPWVSRLAGQVATAIPVQDDPMERLVADYEGSDLRRFHDWFYSQEPHPPERWARTYDRLPARILPACIRRILESPNDLLTRRPDLRRVVRVMLSLGWHPRHIAGLIRSKYERGQGWGQKWREYDPGLRADFYTRLFAGLRATGLDQLEEEGI